MYYVLACGSAAILPHPLFPCPPPLAVGNLSLFKQKDRAAASPEISEKHPQASVCYACWTGADYKCQFRSCELIENFLIV